MPIAGGFVVARVLAPWYGSAVGSRDCCLVIKVALLDTWVVRGGGANGELPVPVLPVRQHFGVAYGHFSFD